MEKKERLDKAIVERQLVTSREKARQLIMAGKVLVNGQTAKKAGETVNATTRIELVQPQMFVGRGGEKLTGALDAFSVPVEGNNCLDIGISTGGFTDCLLQRGAHHVTGIDVGYGQVAWKLRQDPRVTLLERTNIRYLDRSLVDCPFDMAVIDVSFISLSVVLPVVEDMVRDQGLIIALVKPQFEVGKGMVGKGGLVSDTALHLSVLTKLTDSIMSRGHIIIGDCPSPVTGAKKGNQEYFLVYRKRGDNVSTDRNNRQDTT